MTPYEYAKTCFRNGLFASMNVLPIAGRYLICDSDWNVLSTKVSYATADEARAVISKAKDRARRFIK